MVNIQGGSTKNMVVVIRQFDSAGYSVPAQDGKPERNGSYLDVQMARFADPDTGVQVNGNQPPQKVPHFRNVPSKKVEGKYDYGVPYTSNEISKLEKAAGDNKVDIVNHNTGEKVGSALVLVADCKPERERGEGQKGSHLRVLTDTARAYEGKLPEKLLDAQFQGLQADRKLIKERDAEKAKEAEAEGKTAEAEGKEPVAAAAGKDEGPSF